MAKNLLHFLKTHKIFSSLDHSQIKKLIPLFKRIELSDNKILFHQRDPSDYVYILVSGKLSTLLIKTDNHVKTVAHIEEGDVVGEVNALTQESRGFTVKAAKPCVLYRLPSQDFIELCYANPSVMFATFHPAILRSKKIIQILTPSEPSHDIVIAPANPDTDLEEFEKRLSKRIKKFNNVIYLSDFMPEFLDKKMTAHALKEKIMHLLKHRKASQRIIYLLASTDSLLAKYSLKNTNTIYLVTQANLTPNISTELTDGILKKKTFLKNGLVNLVLLHDESIKTPINTAAWLNIHSFHLHHHVRINTPSHYNRLLRFMRDKANGVILSGGGTRGWGHLGALKAIREQKIPIDFIGGTSVGAIIGGSYAIRESYQETFDNFKLIVSTSQYATAWRSLTWPIVSIFDGESFTQALQQSFQNIQIEDLWLPFFCISSNLASLTAEVHRNGSLFEKTRASASIPGIIPPMTIKGDIHLDGGLLNNLPVDIMKPFIGKKGKMIAINLTAALHDTHIYHFPPILTLKKALLNRLHWDGKHYRFPRFIDTILRGMLIGSYAKSKQNGALANILVNLSLRRYRLLHANLKQADRMLDIGYKETTTQIHFFRNKHL